MATDKTQEQLEAEALERVLERAGTIRTERRNASISPVNIMTRAPLVSAQADVVGEALGPEARDVAVDGFTSSYFIDTRESDASASEFDRAGTAKSPGPEHTAGEDAAVRVNVIAGDMSLFPNAIASPPPTSFPTGFSDTGEFLDADPVATEPGAPHVPGDRFAGVRDFSDIESTSQDIRQAVDSKSRQDARRQWNAISDAMGDAATWVGESIESFDEWVERNPDLTGSGQIVDGTYIWTSPDGTESEIDIPFMVDERNAAAIRVAREEVEVIGGDRTGGVRDFDLLSPQDAPAGRVPPLPQGLDAAADGRVPPFLRTAPAADGSVPPDTQPRDTAVTQPVIESSISLVDRVIMAESSGDPTAVGGSGEVGLMQIMESTGLQPGFGVAPISSEDRYDPVKNRAFGTAYLDAMLNRYDGDEEAALIAYNAGFGNADKWLEAGRDYTVLPQQETTQRYVNNVLGGTSAPPTTFADVAAYVGQMRATVGNNELAAAGTQIPGLTYDTSFDMNARDSLDSIWPGLTAGEVQDATDSELLAIIEGTIDTDYFSSQLRDTLSRDGLGEAGGSRETLLADVVAHEAATDAVVTMSYLRPVREAWGKMKSDEFVRWMDATRGSDTVHIDDSENALLQAGYEARDWLGELLPSDRFWNTFAFEGLDGATASAQQKGVAIDGPARVILRAARNFRQD